MEKNILVTGANRGIGKAIVEAFIANGDNVWACCRNKNPEMNLWTELYQRDEQWVKIVEFDICSEPEIESALKSIIKSQIPIDVVVNVAGVGHLNLFPLTSFKEIRRVYEVNLFGLMKICQLVIRPMIRRKSGQIINISSTAAKEIYAGNTVYGASKAAVVAFSQSLAADLAPYGIRVNTVAPGLTRTEMSKVFEADNPQLPLSRSVLGRKIEPVEIADVVVELTSDKMKMINGQMICVNGGSK